MAIGLFASFIQSLAGFGLTVVAMPLFLMIYEPHEIVLMIMLLALVLNIIFAWYLRKHMPRRFIMTLFLASLPGEAAGLAVYHMASPEMLKIIIATIIILFLCIMSAKKITMKETAFRTALAGFLSGITTMCAAMGGPSVILYLSAIGKDKTFSRGACIGYFLLSGITALLFFWIEGEDFSHAFPRAAMLLPFCLIGLWAGNKLFPYLSQNMFNKLVMVLLWFSAAYTLWAAL